MAEVSDSHSKTLVALPRLITLVIIGDLTIRTQAPLRILTPEQPIAAMGNGRIPLGLDIESLPTKIQAAIVVQLSGSCLFHRSAFPGSGQQSPLHRDFG